MGVELIQYQSLIKSLPVRQQCFTTKKTTWKYLKPYTEPRQMNDKVLVFHNDFFPEKELTISREDIFTTQNLRDLVLKTLYWGYPNGMRGRHFENIVNDFPKLLPLAKSSQGKDLSNQELRTLLGQLSEVDGLNISTYSKLLYFLNVKLDGRLCQILDQRLINVFHYEVFLDFSPLKAITYNNAAKFYPQYIDLIHEKAIELDTKAENIEQFLFIFGGNLKHSLSK